jgi:dihydrolipoamide dehydrogenase
MAQVQDLIVVGGGAGGFAAAMRAAALGGKVTVVEESRCGGNCMHSACIPLRFLMVAAQRMASIRSAARLGIQVEGVEMDLEALHDRKDLMIEGLRMGTEELLSDYGIALVQGRGRLIAQDSVAVDGKRIRARNIVIATGSVAAQMPVKGIDLPGVVGAEEAIELRRVPERIAILGSEPWNLELAQYLCAMGSEVVLIESGRQLLPQADREISQRLGKSLHDAGIAIVRGTSAKAIRQDGDRLALTLGEGQGEVIIDRILAARRLPNTTGLGLRDLGVQTEQGAVLVDERMQTNVAHIYAVGDAAGGPMWSHKATYEGIVAGENAMGLISAMNYDHLPRCLHTWPQVAWVGLTEEQAEARGIEVEVGRFPTAFNPYAMILDETAGTIKVIASKKYGKILGVHVMAPGAIDLINAATVAMLSEATVRELMHFFPAHPSLGEAMVDAAMDVERRSLHLPR